MILKELALVYTISKFGIFGLIFVVSTSTIHIQ